MGDQDKTLDADEEAATEEAQDASDAAVTIESEDTAESAEAEAPKLSLANKDDEGGEELLGAPSDSVDVPPINN